MSELLDKQVDTGNENLKIKIPGVHASPRNMCNENKSRRKKQLPHKICLLKGELYKAVSEDWLVRFR